MIYIISVTTKINNKKKVLKYFQDVTAGFFADGHVFSDHKDLIEYFPNTQAYKKS